MSRPDKETLIIAISATALFDLAEQDREFREAVRLNRDQAITAYRAKMREMEQKPLAPGPAMPLIRAFLDLNSAERARNADEALGAALDGQAQESSISESPLVEVIVVSQNSPETGLRILNAIETQGLSITRSAFLAGDPVAPILEAFGVDLFLSGNEVEVQSVTDLGVCAAALLVGEPLVDYSPDARLRLAFDGDAVLFDDESEALFKEKGIDEFQSQEKLRTMEPMKDGPFANFVRKLGDMQARITSVIEYAPVRISLVTARNAPSHLRALMTLRAWGVYFDEAYFLGGMDKTPVLNAIKPHLFFDDQESHIIKSHSVVPSARVLYRSDSPLHPNRREPKPQGTPNE